MSMIIASAIILTGLVLTPRRSYLGTCWRKATSQRQRRNLTQRCLAILRHRQQRRRPLDARQLAVEVAARLRAGAPTDEAYRTALARLHPNGDPVSPQLPEFDAALIMSTELGAPVAEVIERVATGIGDAHAAGKHRKLALVGPIATVRLLAVMPLVAFALGHLLGANPIKVIIDGGLGTICGLLGIICGCIGLLWMRKLIAIAQKELP